MIKKLSNSIRKFIRLQKAKIRREVLDTKKQKEMIDEIYSKFLNKKIGQEENIKKQESEKEEKVKKQPSKKKKSVEAKNKKIKKKSILKQAGSANQAGKKKK